MRGSIIGDIIGSAFVQSPQSSPDFQLLQPFSAYTDDTILTLATAEAILAKEPYDEALKRWAQKYPTAGYRKKFLAWALTDKKDIQYNSKGDGAARRVAPIGFAAVSLEEAMIEAEAATVITHTLKSKIRAAKAMTGAIYLAKTGHRKSEIREFLADNLKYVLPEKVSKYDATELMKKHKSPAPAAILAFLDSTNFEDAIRKAIWLEGPSNTLGSITGGLAQAYYKHIPKALIRKSLSRIDEPMENLIHMFETKFCQDVINDKHEIRFNFH